ncbi:MAG: recombinase family protein [Oscillospiraceae bacterium]|nr:recombinase family protein [Oscillospiraceae bacterium]
MIYAAGYCRVSTDAGDQANSFVSQQLYFRDYIARQPGLELWAIYADEGISGTGTSERAAFCQMLEDARSGLFQLILTKEVSRFSRNLLDTIRYTRELKALGVAILFITDGIHTMEPDAELRLSIMASIAQEESRRTSQRVTWGQQRQMEKGVVFGPSLLGYRVEKGHITVEPTGAELVQRIFHAYAVEERSTAAIAAALTEEGCMGRVWRASGIVKILHNEKYVGDLVQRKSYTPDYLSHARHKNRGQVPLVILRDHHEPIVSRELWTLAQERLMRNNRCGGASVSSDRFPFSGKIRCGNCGRLCVSRLKKRGGESAVRYWRCNCGLGVMLRDDDAGEMLRLALAYVGVQTPSPLPERYIRRLVESIELHRNHQADLCLRGTPTVFHFDF